MRTGLLAVLIAGILAGCREVPTGRRILTNTWDTLFVIGSADPADTTLVRPRDLFVHRNQLLVIEDLDQQVRAFDIDTGRKTWVFGRKGEGPGEMTQLYDVFSDPEGNLRVWDAKLRKLLQLDNAGRFLDEVFFPDLWGLSVAPQPFGESLIWVQLSENRPTFITGWEGGDPVDSVSIEWPVPEGLPYRPYLITRTAGSARGWAMGLLAGPYFAVGTEAVENVAIHPFHVQIPYGYSPSIQLFRHDPRADSARWGALDLAMDERGIYVLTGGRPPMAAHQGEPSRFVDVYGFDGSYRHSLFLPVDAEAIATEDGVTFFVLQNQFSGFPQILGIRPVVEGN